MLHVLARMVATLLGPVLSASLFAHLYVASTQVSVAIIGLLGTFASSVATVIVALINRRDIRATKRQVNVIQNTARESVTALQDVESLTRKPPKSR